MVGCVDSKYRCRISITEQDKKRWNGSGMEKQGGGEFALKMGVVVKKQK